MEQRHFWRRAIAVLIDFIILSQLAFYLVVPFADGDRVRLSGGVYQTVDCRTVPLLPEAMASFKAQGVETETASLCTSYQNGFYAGATLLVSDQTNTAGDISSNAVTISVPIDRQGEGVEPVFPVSYLAPVVVFFGIVLMTWLWNGRTFGKMVTRIVVVTSEGDCPGLMRVLSREALKFAPVIVLFSIGLLVPGYTLEQTLPLLKSGENIALVLGFLGFSTFVYILWWVAPMIWWNGAMPYDRIARSLVERSYV